MKASERSGRKQDKSPSYMYIKHIGRSIKFDMGRYERRGFPEVVLSEGKSDKELLLIVQGLTEEGKPVVISRIDDRRGGALSRKLRGNGRRVRFEQNSSVMFVIPSAWKTASHRELGRIAIVTAGSSDLKAAQPTMALLDFLGYSYGEFHDCGIAGMQRTVKAAAEVIKGGYSVAVVFAGMEGALASVFTSLVPIPVIGVPTSTGYGFGGGGIAALNSMLQSCIPGLVVVNIDNGVGAAAAAISILRSSAGVK